MSEDKLTYTPQEFGRLFGKSQSWAYRQLYAGRIEGITEFGRVMIPATETEKILKAAGRYLGAQAKSSTVAKTKAALKEAKKHKEGVPFKIWVERRRNKYQPAAQTRTSGRNWQRSRNKT